MASTIIHYIMANKLVAEFHVIDSERFVLGATLAPDASSHDDGTYNTAHFDDFLDEEGIKGINWLLFEEKYGEKIFEDSFYLGYWCHLIQDAIWYHDMYGKFIRIHQAENRREYLQKGYRDYDRLNYLLIKEYRVSAPTHTVVVPAIEEISTERFQAMYENLQKYFEAKPCEKSELELYTWDAVTEYMEKSIRLCVSEYDAMTGKKKRVPPREFFLISDYIVNDIRPA